VYLLIDGNNGEVLATLDGGELTARRTGAASALAARFLAPKTSRTLLMIGTGRLSINLINAHATVRPIEDILIYGRSEEKSEKIAEGARKSGHRAKAVTDIEIAAGQADIISCATLSTEAILKGEWLTPGTHVDLVGAFKKTMRETDDDVMVRADGIFVDTREGAFSEAGDILQAIESGAVSSDPVTADLFELCSRVHIGRRNEKEITVFKSVGASLEDLVGAILAYEQFIAELR
jgi:ornithine cyclodeaminase